MSNVHAEHSEIAPANGPADSASPFKKKVRAYVALTKPRIIELLLVTTIPTMFLAAHGIPSWWLVIATLIGGTLAAGGANTLNCYIDRDIDAIMNRTKNRPLVSGAVTPREALVFGLVLSVLSVGWLTLTANLLSALLAAAAIAFYVIVYTMFLKRRTSQNIVWGGAAGCMPVLIGWSAVTDSLTWTPVALFAVIFFWTPPHYWPLAERFREDYANAGVPMLPVVASVKNVAWQMIGHTIAMLLSSFSIIFLAKTGPVYTFASIALGAWFLYLVIAFTVRASKGVTGKELKAMSVFHASLTYLTLLFLALAIDPFVSF